MAKRGIRVPLSNDPVRPCGKCTVCCTVLAIDELDKPLNTPCPHLAPEGGCGQYEQRPHACRAFDCVWRKGLGTSRARPDRSGVMFMTSDDGNAVVALVLPGHHNAWRRGEIKDIVDWHVDHGVPVFVVDDGQRHTLMPGKSHMPDALLDRLKQWFEESRLG